MGKHTEGTWAACEDGWIEGANGETVCEYAGCGSHAAEWNEADLNLVLAAPDLLEALSEVVEEADSYTARTGKPVYNWLDKARAAITKAKGAQQ